VGSGGVATGDGTGGTTRTGGSAAGGAATGGSTRTGGTGGSSGTATISLDCMTSSSKADDGTPCPPGTCDSS
jgi:hypothetical protein